MEIRTDTAPKATDGSEKIYRLLCIVANLTPCLLIVSSHCSITPCNAFAFTATHNKLHPRSNLIHTDTRSTPVKSWLFREDDNDEPQNYALCSGADDQSSLNRRDALALLSTTITTIAAGYTYPEVSKASTAPQPTTDASLTAAVQKLWELDSNRLRPGKDYAIRVQAGKKPYQKDDVAPGPLFQFVDPSVFNRPTYRLFVALLNNYSAQTCSPEDVTDSERAENYEFLRAAMKTPVMQYCYQYCRSRNPDKVPETQDEFIKLLYKIWFKLYRRCDGEVADSSGFEHVFVGETKDGKVIGFHNWIQLYLQELKGTVNYRGFIKPKVIDGVQNAPPDGDDHVLTFQFTWNGIEKLVGTSFIGVSPEFELALYTMVFLVGKQENLIALDTGTDRFGLNAKCFKIAKGKVASCYVESLAHQVE